MRQMVARMDSCLLRLFMAPHIYLLSMHFRFIT